jgi:error-prone DNA polymerase
MYLNCHTYYSLRYGTVSPEVLVKRVAEMGIRRLALTDINNATTMPDFVKLCREQGIASVAGMEFRKGDRLLYIVLARNPEGFRRINAFLSRHNIDKTAIPTILSCTVTCVPSTTMWY